jgi:hypothetical protein
VGPITTSFYNAHGPTGINCSLFFVRGTAILDGATQQKEIYVDVHDGPEFTITNDNDEVVEFILLQVGGTHCVACDSATSGPE